MAAARGSVSASATKTVKVDSKPVDDAACRIRLIDVYRYSVYRFGFMIRSFGDARTQALFRDEFVRDFQGIARPAKRRLEAINAAHLLDDLLVPPSNRLEKLKGNLKGFFSIRINDQWRVIFIWENGNASLVEIVDYH